MDEEPEVLAIDVVWIHYIEAEPIRLVSLLDNNRYEVRKLEFFRDGQVGYADRMRSNLGMHLGKLPVPPLTEINADPQFNASGIESALFNKLWFLQVLDAGKRD
ncbi:DUF6881 domain-containing protein [Paraburkholderia caribensis]|uniref:DUF6881 domain-containing protein n=1 Tax=Paraburkholderia caribensis TaxID=75105 RepID=UPI00285F1CE1|nr:hypothetical protein [Paraburkholderia caribensis]MDR6384003.1 hypothetical protein [Paraburkholderia caribensis]